MFTNCAYLYMWKMAATFAFIWCFKTLIVWPCLSIAIQLCWNFRLYCFCVFQILCFQIEGVAYMYPWMQLIRGCLWYNKSSNSPNFNHGIWLEVECIIWKFHYWSGGVSDISWKRIEWMTDWFCLWNDFGVVLFYSSLRGHHQQNLFTSCWFSFLVCCLLPCCFVLILFPVTKMHMVSLTWS